MSFHILLLESDRLLAKNLSAALEQAGYTVILAVDLPDFMKKLFELHPDLVILGGVLSKENRTVVFPQIRTASYLPIVVLGSRELEVQTLEGGADAYITKPPNHREVVARVRSLLRRKMMLDPSRKPTKTKDI